jgi:hypothetical protein
MRATKVVSTLVITFLAISTTGTAQEATLERTRDSEALQSRIKRAKQEVTSRKGGHVIVGQVDVENGDDAALVSSQMLILDDGLFAGPTRDLVRPVGFRMHQYAPFDLELKGKSGDVVDVGVIKMRRLSDRDLVSVKGQLMLEGSENSSQASVSLSVAGGPVNTPNNGSQPRPRWAKPVDVPVTPSGLIDAGGFSPIKYYCSITAPNYVSKGFHVDLRPRVGADLGTVTLEKPRRIVIEYIPSKDGPFDLEAAKKVVLAGGDRWKATPDIYGWDLEFTQKNGEILFNYSYAPCFIKDLGKTELRDFLNVDGASAKATPRNMAVKDGHVYLLNQRHWKRTVLFKIQIQQPE